jgi:fructose-specific phosphotransferase system IIA component
MGEGKFMPIFPGQTVAPAVTNPPTSRERPAAPLGPHIRPELFVSEIQARKKPAIIDELVEMLHRAGVTRYPEAVRQALLQREALGSTGLGKGIAVPHARSTMVSERAIVVARSKRGVDFEAQDGQPVHLCFLIVAPPVEKDEIYLQLLARVVRGIRLARTRQRLLDAPDFEAVRSILVRAADD